MPSPRRRNSRRYYRLEKEEEGDLELQPSRVAELRGAYDTGTRRAEEDEAPLSTLIERLNERFKTEFDADDLIENVRRHMLADESLREAAKVNDRENFNYVFHPALDQTLIDQIDRQQGHRDFVNRYFEKTALMEFIRHAMGDEIYRELNR